MGRPRFWTVSAAFTRRREVRNTLVADLTDISHSEFIANGMVDGTAFIEILPEGRMSILGFL